MKASGAKCLKDLKVEKTTFKKLLAEAELDKPSLKDIGTGRLLTPNRCHRAVEELQERFGVSERRASGIAGQHRSTPLASLLS